MVNVGNHTCYGNGTNFLGGNQSMQIYPWSSSSLGYLELVALRQANIGYDRLDPRWTKCKGNWKMWVLYQLVISQDPWDWHTFNIRINHSCTDIFMVHGPFYGKMRLWEPIFCAMKFRALKCHAFWWLESWCFLVPNFRGLDIFVFFGSVCWRVKGAHFRWKIELRKIIGKMICASSLYFLWLYKFIATSGSILRLIPGDERDSAGFLPLNLSTSWFFSWQFQKGTPSSWLQLARN